MMQYPNYEIERFEDEGGNCCPIKPIDQETEKVPVIDLSGDDSDARKEIQEHQKS